MATLATLFSFLTASAQGEWKWAHYWSGGDGTTFGDFYNEITNTAFDDDGNIYVYGTMGGSPQFDGLTFQFVNNGTVLNKNDRSILLAKFDTLGNMLWYKVVKGSGSWSVPRWMEIRNNQIHISGDTELEYVDWGWDDVWLYYLDTLITGYQVHNIPVENRTPPCQTGRWTFFATLDTDGELLEDIFVESYSRERTLQGDEHIRTESPLCLYSGYLPTPVHKDLQGNTYVFTPIQYQGVENDSLTLVVNSDPNKTYNLFLPGNVDPDNQAAYISNAMLYKFSPTGELLFAKLFVDHTEGIASSWDYIGDSINKYFSCRFTGMSYDEEDNMYLTGYIQLTECMYGLGGELHNYPVHIWFDNTHFLTINDISSAQACNFIIKYNTSGDVIWCNQAYTHVLQPNGFAYTKFYGNCIKDNTIFVCGDAEDYANSGSLIYFEQNEENFISRFASNQKTRAYYAAFNKHTGSYMKNDILPDEKHSILALTSATPATTNNQLVLFAIKGKSPNKIGIARWNTDGTFIDYSPTNTYPTTLCMGVGPTIMDNRGYALVSLNFMGNMAFNNSVSINGSAINSNAGFALYHNPEFTQPFVPDDSVGIEDYLGRRESDIYLYPNPTSGEAVVCGYMYGYRSIELLDLQGRKLATLLDSPDGTSLPVIDLSPYPSGTYLVKINFERGVSVVRKVVRS